MSQGHSAWLEQIVQIETAEFEIYAISEIAASPLVVRLELRYDLVAVRADTRREEARWFVDDGVVSERITKLARASLGKPVKRPSASPTACVS